MTTPTYDVMVIGGGIVGVATARALALRIAGPDAPRARKM